MNSLLGPYRGAVPVAFESSWESPSNIAFVKYWGKKGHQLPANPSVSMSLNECKTLTKTKFTPSTGLTVDLKLDGQNNERFALKIRSYLETLQTELPWIAYLSVEIETANTFPHGTGIASSASGLSAFVLTLVDYLRHLNPEGDEALFFKRASYLSRLASGSACRSVYGGFAAWGESTNFETSDLYASPVMVHANLAALQDTVLVVSAKEKNVSSRAGHGLMGDHPYALSRFAQAKVNFDQCMSALKSGDIETIGKILEAEALSLHAMMLTSSTPYILLKPNTLAAIDAIWDFRRETKLPLYFTLDAGPNLHLIYPEEFKSKIFTFITHELTPLSEQIIDDKVGAGPRKC
jgi:diphosphomevalonate decarboxylase